MNAFASTFLTRDTPVIKRTYTVSKEVHQHIRDVFPETGFAQYFPGFVLTLLSKQLKQKGIKDVTDRALLNATFTGILSDLNAIIEASDRHGRSGASGVHEGASSDERVTADAQEEFSWQDDAIEETDQRDEVD